MTGARERRNNAISASAAEKPLLKCRNFTRRRKRCPYKSRQLFAKKTRIYTLAVQNGTRSAGRRVCGLRPFRHGGYAGSDGCIRKDADRPGGGWRYLLSLWYGCQRASLTTWKGPRGAKSPRRRDKWDTMSRFRTNSPASPPNKLRKNHHQETSRHAPHAARSWGKGGSAAEMERRNEASQEMKVEANKLMKTSGLKSDKIPEANIFMKINQLSPIEAMDS